VYLHFSSIINGTYIVAPAACHVSPSKEKSIVLFAYLMDILA
jgi:hypothetical protein